MVGLHGLTLSRGALLVGQHDRADRLLNQEAGGERPLVERVALERQLRSLRASHRDTRIRAEQHAPRVSSALNDGASRVRPIAELAHHQP